MARKLHFVGTIPHDAPADDEGALSWPVEQARGVPLTAVPRDLDPDWLVDWLRSRADRTEAFETVLAGEYGVDDYVDFRAYRVRKGVRLRPEHVSMRRVDRIAEVSATYRAFRESRPELAGLPLQVSLPAPVDLVVFAEVGGLALAPGLPWGTALRHPVALVRALRHLPVYQEAALAEVAALTAAHGDLLTWQVETPLCTLAMVKAATVPGAQAVFAPLLAAHLAAVFTGMAALGATATLHLCYGDYAHKALLSPRDLGPLVRLLNVLGPRLDRAGVRRPVVHVPCAHGADLAPVHPGFYQPLGRLDAGWTEVVAGVASTDESRSVTALEEFERAAGRPAVAVAAACGLGRQTLAEAEPVLRAMHAAAEHDQTR
ncbi:hypothetical protein JOF53_008130 [Crossiella equi]|uniref:Uroporphyrinogen decarboxylase (URO-D) domain-containing protein n=1 Tax=Crossiella equi TaxID=130796 RepID=A0ABS5ARQ8_9PSEU|nr:hypothetical protein [Crossiella equi]MBP2479258.1 hypothetical protein [Crossiella equi]